MCPVDFDADAEESPVPPEPLSLDAITPRGGFMARPGLKPPPRHAVVVRGGEVEPSERIPRARSSHPPEAPVSVPVSLRANDKPTLRAIPTPKPEALVEPASPAAAFESVPPPSDMPVVASLRAPDSVWAQARVRSRSRWTIAAAITAGLLLGLASVAATRLEGEPAAAAAAVPDSTVGMTPSALGLVEAPTSTLPSATAATSARRPGESTEVRLQPATTRPGASTSKRSIF